MAGWKKTSPLPYPLAANKDGFTGDSAGLDGTQALANGFLNPNLSLNRATTPRETFTSNPVLEDAFQPNSNPRTMRYLLPFLVVLLFIPEARAQDELGIGIILGEPTGLSAKKWLSSEHAIDAALAWSFSHDTRIQLHADYLYHRVHLFSADDYQGRIPFYFGFGGRAIIGGDDDDTQIGARFPFGIGKTLDNAPIELFLEIVPILDLAPDTEFDLNGALGIRYYLGQ